MQIVAVSLSTDHNHAGGLAAECAWRTRAQFRNKAGGSAGRAPPEHLHDPHPMEL